MTRINLVPPAELHDQHLFAEWREIKMVPKSLGRSLTARGLHAVLQMIPKEFILGTGHVSFFYDKGFYLKERYRQLTAELEKRGVNYNSLSKLDSEGLFELYPALNNGYTPTPIALKLIRDRIAIRVAAKPSWYRRTVYEQ
jgi:deoxyribonuclease (pyrimidine dimer)